MPADSRKYFHANTMLSAQNTAAPNPGPRCPHQRTNNEPNAGPTTAPALVAEESQPNPFARSSGLLASATYACSTPTVPPPTPCTTRDSKRTHSVPASPKTTYANAEISKPVITAGRRPKRSETRPHVGALRSCAIENAEMSNPMTKPVAPMRVA